MFLFLQVLCTWRPGPQRWVKKETVLVLTDPIPTPSWTQLEVVGWSYSMLEPPVLASLTLSPKVAAFSGHSGEYIIQCERNGGCKGWILGEQQALQAWLCMYLWDTSWGGAVLVDLTHGGHLLVTCRHPALHCSRRRTRRSMTRDWCDPLLVWK